MDGDVGGGCSGLQAVAYGLRDGGERAAAGGYHLDAEEDGDGGRRAVGLLVGLEEAERGFGGEAGLGYEEVCAGFDFAPGEVCFGIGASVGVDGRADAESVGSVRGRAR